MSRYSTLWLQGSRYEQVPWPRWPRQWVPIRRVCSLQQPQPVLLSELSKTATAWHIAFIPWDYWLHAESDTRGAPHMAVFRGLLATSGFPGLHLFGNITFEQLYLTFKIIPFSCMKHWKCTGFSLVYVSSAIKLIMLILQSFISVSNINCFLPTASFILKLLFFIVDLDFETWINKLGPGAKLPVIIIQAGFTNTFDKIPHRLQDLFITFLKLTWIFECLPLPTCLS